MGRWNEDRWVDGGSAGESALSGWWKTCRSVYVWWVGGWLSLKHLLVGPWSVFGGSMEHLHVGWRLLFGICWPVSSRWFCNAPSNKENKNEKSGWNSLTLFTSYLYICSEILNLKNVELRFFSRMLLFLSAVKQCMSQIKPILIS